ncbi:MAG TPA: tetratricopeptide repeat protein [Stellaceae bacterium]|nr:tetratricopeptide repeat protein [Stellaceae bacterium]
MPSGASQYLIGDVGGGAIVLQGEHLSVGFTADQVRALIEAATKGADERVAEASRWLGVTQGAMRTMLATLGQTDVPDERLVEKLAEVFEQYRKAAAAIAALRPENPAAQEHAAKASQAAASGDRNEARHHLQVARAAAEAAAEEARQLAREAEGAAAQQMLQAARAAAAEAELALTALDYLEAAQLFGEAALLVPSGEPNEKGILLWRQADALQQQGEERGDNTALQQAIPLYRRALELLPRERVPLDWATIQNNLGSALATLGERESGTARLEDAVAAYRAALEERTRERVPLDWAMTQTNLGTALWRLGERESGTAHLEEAVAAYRAALTESPRDRVPLD